MFEVLGFPQAKHLLIILQALGQPNLCFSCKILIASWGSSQKMVLYELILIGPENTHYPSNDCNPRFCLEDLNTEIKFNTTLLTIPYLWRESGKMLTATWRLWFAS